MRLATIMNKIKEFFKRIKELSNKDKLFIKILAWLLVLQFLFCALDLTIYFKNKNNEANAEYIDLSSDTLVNFNQQVINDYTHGSFSSNQEINFANNIIVGHHIYIKFKVNSIGSDANGLYFGNSAGNYSQLVGIIQANTPRTIETIVVAEYSYLNTYMNSAMSWSIMAIDLDIMFGSENLPNLEQAKNLFISDYYPYNTGSAIFKNTLDSYASGFAAAYKGQKITLSPEYIYNNISQVQLYGIMGDVARYTSDIAPFYSFALNYQMSINLLQTIPAGTTIKFSCLLGRAEYNDNTDLQIGYIINGAFYSIATLTATEEFDQTSYFEIYLNFPIDIENIILYVNYTPQNEFQSHSVNIGDIELQYNLVDIQSVIYNADQQGYLRAEEYYQNYYDWYYSPVGPGYNAIFNAGVDSVDPNTSTFRDSWAWLGLVFHSVGDILSMQLMPGLPLGLFVALPLLVGILFFIVKIAKGSGG